MTGVLKVKVHKELLDYLVKQREQKNVYETNNLLKFVGAYYVLKSLTTTGVIQNYFSKEIELCTVLHCSRSTLYKYIRECEKRGYLKRSAGNLVLSSYQSFCETFDVIYTQFVTIIYDYEKQKINHCLELARLKLGEIERSEAFENRLAKFPELKKELEKLINPDKNGCYQKSLAALQILAYKKGHEKLLEIFMLNPDSDLNVHSIRKLFNFKSYLSVAYLKKKLFLKDLIHIQKRVITSPVYRSIPKRYVDFDIKKNVHKWHLPDKLELAPILHV